MTTKLYDEERGTDGYDNLVMKHMMAMTSEDLHGKAAIAVELAYRDKQIAQLREALEKIADLDGNWGPFPETNKQWCAMVIVTAREALEESQ